MEFKYARLDVLVLFTFSELCLPLVIDRLPLRSVAISIKRSHMAAVTSLKSVLPNIAAKYTKYLAKSS